MRVDCYPEAPSEWPRKTVGEVAEIDPPYRLEVGQVYPFVEMASVRENFGGIDRFEQRIWDRSGLCRFKEDDLMLGKITPCAENGKAALVSNLPDTFGIGSTEFFVLSPNDGIVPEFLFAAVTAGPFHRRLVSRMEGSTGRLRITRDTLKKWLALPVPPPDEQRRIAAALKLADDAIQKARVELAAAQDLKRSLEAGLLTGKIDKQGRAKVKTKAGMYPHGWAVLPLKTLAVIGSGVTLNQDRAAKENACRYLTVAHVQRGSISSDDPRYLELSEEERKTRLLEAGDILVVEGHANSMEIGRAAMFEDMGVESTFQNHLFRVRADANLILPKFLLHILNSERVQRYWNAVCNTSSGLNTINRRNLRNVLIPHPDTTEQQEIVDALDAAEQNVAQLALRAQALEEVKRSLLQNLLTGKIRIPEGAIHA